MFYTYLRRLVANRHLSDDRASDARADFASMAIVRYPHGFLSRRVWELRQNLNAYDAFYVTLAETLGVPLITCDRRMRRAPGHRASVEVFAPR